MLKNCCFWTVVLEKTLESPLDCKEIQPVHPEGNQSWVFIGRTDVVAEAPILWLLDMNSQLIGKDSDAGKDWRQEEKEVTEDKMVGWHHQLVNMSLRKFPGAGDDQGSLACYSPWGRKESTEQLNSNCGPAQRQPLSVTVWMPCAHIIITHHKLLSWEFRELNLVSFPDVTLGKLHIHLHLCLVFNLWQGSNRWFCVVLYYWRPKTPLQTAEYTPVFGV